MDPDPDIVRVALELDRNTDRLSGSLSSGSEPLRSFDGWLELGVLLDEARRRDRVAETGSDQAALGVGWRDPNSASNSSTSSP